MFDISFIIPCNDLAYDINSTIEALISLLSYTNKIEIVLINNESCTNKTSTSSYERNNPDNILIVNIDQTVDDISCMEIGICYSDSLCYLYIESPFKRITPDLFDSIIANKDACDDDIYKYIKDKYKYILSCFYHDSFKFDQANELPELTDYRDNAGTVDPHYFFQDIYVANKLFKQGIKHIYDIGSRIDGYISHLISMNIHVTMIDIRPLPYAIDNLDFIESNASDLSDLDDNSINALSCLHALEHFGLGRYGDPIDHDGWLNALFSFKRVIAPNGYLYLSVPVGKYETVMFNAHRIFNPMTVVFNLTPTFSILEFALLHEGVMTVFDLTKYKSIQEIEVILSDIRSNLMGYYDCGIFTFKKSQETLS